MHSHKVPTGPGLGIELDMAAIERYRIPLDDPMAQALTENGFYAGAGGRISYTVVYPEGAALHYKGDIRQHFVQGNGPAWVPGVRLEEWADDGSAAWTALWEEVQAGPSRGRYAEHQQQRKAAKL